MSASEPWVSEAELHAYLDGELAAARIEAVERHLAEHPEDAARCREYREYGHLIRRLYGPLLGRPVPPDLLAPALVLPRPAPRRGLARRLAALAAAILLLLAAGAGGWALRPYLDPFAQPAQRFVADASDAHRIYSAEVRHPVEVPASEEEHLVRWLSNRLGVGLVAPDLQPAGFQLMGGRLLPAGAAPAAQLMYQDEGGRRVTLYIRPGSAGEPTAFRFERLGELAAFSWRDRDASFALLGEVPRGELLRLARLVHEALSG